MKAAVYHGPHEIRLEERPAPIAGEGELLVRVATTGICGTDVSEFLHGPVQFPVAAPHPFSGHSGPMIPGHEFSGHVVGLGAGVAGGFAEGDLVSTGAGVSCGGCAPCQRGASNLCERYWTVGLQRDGGLAELVAVPARACVNLTGRGISADLGALAQPMSIALHAVRRGDPVAEQPVLVCGAGGIGVFVAYAAAQLGAEVIAIDADPDRLAIAAALGARDTVLVDRAEPLAQRLAPLLDRVLLVFECTGAEPMLQAVLSRSRRGTRIVVVGHQARPVEVDFRLVSLGERELVGTVAHVFSRDYGDAVDLVARSPHLWHRIAPAVRPLEELLTGGIEPAAAGRAPQIKSLFDPSLHAPRPLRV